MKHTVPLVIQLSLDIKGQLVCDVLHVRLAVQVLGIALRLSDDFLDRFAFNTKRLALIRATYMSLRLDFSQGTKCSRLLLQTCSLFQSRSRYPPSYQAGFRWPWWPGLLLGTTCSRFGLQVYSSFQCFKRSLTNEVTLEMGACKIRKIYLMVGLQKTKPCSLTDESVQGCKNTQMQYGYELIGRFVLDRILSVLSHDLGTEKI